MLVDVLQSTAPTTARAVEARLLPEATRLPTGRLRARALALLADADALDARRRTAEKQADVRSYASPWRACPRWPPTCPPRCRRSALTPSTG